MKLGEVRKKMKKKIFIGSIIAVIILVLVSFTSVVGYNSVESNVKASPLFKVRTNRAIGAESKGLTCRYVGKGNILPFPERDDKSVLTQKVVDSIRKMDDKTFERFIAYVIDFSKKDNRFNGVNSDRIRESLYLLRDSDTPIPILDADTENKDHTPRTITCVNCITAYSPRPLLVCILLLPLLPLILLIKFWCAIFQLATAVSPL